MSFIPKEVVQEIKKIDLFTYLKNYEPTELVHVSGNEYTTKTHDSIRISNGLWNWFSAGIGGKNALDFLMKVRGYNFVEAVNILLDKTKSGPLVYNTTNYIVPKYEEKKLILPQKSSTNYKVINYLMSRCIDKEIIFDCIKKGFIYEDVPCKNVVFVGYNEKNEAKFACVRATNSTRYMHDCKGSSKQYSFRLLSSQKDDSIHLFESAIDLLSYATLLKKHGMNYKNYNLMSLSGVYQPAKVLEESKVPIVLENYLKNNPKTRKIVLHFDNDITGRNASKALEIILKNKYIIENKPAPSGKDFNDYLCSIVKEKSKKYEKER